MSAFGRIIKYLLLVSEIYTKLFLVVKNFLDIKNK